MKLVKKFMKRRHNCKLVYSSLRLHLSIIFQYSGINPICTVTFWARHGTYIQRGARHSYIFRHGYEILRSPHRLYYENHPCRAQKQLHPCIKFQPCRTQNINSVNGVIINNNNRSARVKYRTSVFARTSTRCARLAPYLRTSVRYLNSTDLTLGRSLVNIYLKSS